MLLPVTADSKQEMEREDREVRLPSWCRVHSHCRGRAGGTDCRGRAGGTDCRGRAGGTDCRGGAGGTDCRGRAAESSCATCLPYGCSVIEPIAC